MTPVERQGMIDALLLDDVRIIKDDMQYDDTNYLMFLLENREPYSKWTDAELEESFQALEANK